MKTAFQQAEPLPSFFLKQSGVDSSYLVPLDYIFCFGSNRCFFMEQGEREQGQCPEER